jgi:aldose sugar dehydrogenase
MRLGALLGSSLVAVTVALVSAAGCSSTEANPDTSNDGTQPPPGGSTPSPSAPDGDSPSDPGDTDGGTPRPDLPPAGPPVETRPPNAPDQEPAFPGQTRAPSRVANVAFDTRVVASGLENPWSIAFLPDGALLVTERPGRMRIVSADGALSPPLGGVPAVDARGQGGLLDVTLDPSFAQSSLVYFSYSEPRDGGNGTAVARGRLVREGGARLADVQVIWRMTPTMNSTFHFGSRLVFTPDGFLFVTLGERGGGRSQARELGSAFGKIVRIRPDGTAPPDNPFAGQAGALPEIWSVGHRNVQAAALHPQTGALWVVDHGPRGGDEVNVVRPGKDYGWPLATYGLDYDGTPIGEGITSAPGVEQPVYYWDPSIAPCGMAFYDANAFPAWRGSLFVGALAGTHLVRLTIDGERIIGEERLLVDEGRIRDVRVGPAGTVFVSNESRGRILELVPSGG